MDACPAGGDSSEASTDFGNVGQVVPSFTLRFVVSEMPVPGHALAMTETSKTDLVHNGALDTAKGLALTACDLLADPRVADGGY